MDVGRGIYLMNLLRGYAMENDLEERYCVHCDCNVQAWVSCVYGVGQNGGIVIAKSFCCVCERKIHERIVDKDI